MKVAPYVDLRVFMLLTWTAGLKAKHDPLNLGIICSVQVAIGL